VLRRLKELRDLAGLRQEELGSVGNDRGLDMLSRKTISGAENGASVNVRTAGLLAKKLSLKYGRRIAVEDLVGAEKVPESQPAEWHLVGLPSTFTIAPNGLQWRVQRLEHKWIPGRVGRGKFYDLRHLSSKYQSDFQGYLVARHAKVCDSVGAHPNIARSYGVFPDRPEDCTWWVVDEWLEGCTLADLLERGPLPRPTLKQAMRDIANGLAGLHAAGVIRRNLTPASIMVTDKGAVLTDFELARLSGNVPTVSADAKWHGDVYVAPEIPGAVEPTPGADLYSWSIVLTHAAAGVSPETPGQAKNLLSQSGLPKRLVDFAEACILRPVNKRPQTVDELLRVLRKWS